MIHEVDAELQRQHVVLSLEDRNLEERIHIYVVSVVNVKNLQLLDTDAQRTVIEQHIIEFLKKEDILMPSSKRAIIIDNLINRIVGFGPIQHFLDDDNIQEIMVNGPNRVFVERQGKIEMTSVKFENDAEVLHVIERIISPLGRRIDESSPLVDGRLPDGSRINAIISPLSISGPCVTIRKFAKDPFTIEQLIENRTLSSEMAEFLSVCVRTKLNFLVSGGTGSGKTTMLNVLSNFISDDERIVTIEDSAELRLNQLNLVSLETRPDNVEGKGAYSIRDLVKNTLRMRPDRIIVGEVRGSEAIDMLQAMNTGHEGSLTTIHANSSKDAISRLEQMVLMSGTELPLNSLRDFIASALHIIVQQDRLVDGQRKIVSICEVNDNNEENINISEIFSFVQEGIDSSGYVHGHFEASGIIPRCLEKIKAFGIKIDESIFRGTR